MKKTVKYYFKNEKELMLSLGLKPTSGSGNGIVKEDGQNEYIIAQLKSTESDNINIKRVDLNSLFYNSIVSHKLPLFINQTVNGEVLLSMRLQDLPDIATYIVTGKTQKRTDDVIFKKETTKDSIVVKSGGRLKVKQKLQEEREKRYGRCR